MPIAAFHGKAAEVLLPRAKIRLTSLLSTRCNFEKSSTDPIRVPRIRENRVPTSGVRRKLLWEGGFIQWHMLVVCIWCTLFVTSQLDVIFMFPNERLAKFVDIICIFFYTRSPKLICHCTEYKLSALQVMKCTHRYDTTVHNCKNIRLRIEKGE